MQAASGGAASADPGQRRMPHWFGTWLLIVTWLPVLVLVAYFVVLLRDLPGLLRLLFWNTDAVSKFVIARSVNSFAPPPAAVFFSPGDPFYTTFWYDLIVRQLPFHTFLEEYGQYGFSLLGLALMVVVSWRLSGPWAGMMTACLAAAAAPSVLLTLVAQGYHGVTWVATIVLAGFAVLLVERSDELKTKGALALAFGLAIVVGLFAGACLASDQLLLIVGLFPFALAPCAIWAICRRKALTRAVDVVLVTTLVMMGTTIAIIHIESSADYVTLPFKQVMTARYLGEGLWLLAQGVLLNDHWTQLGGKLYLFPWQAWFEILPGAVAVGLPLGLGAMRIWTVARQGGRDSQAVYLLFWLASAASLLLVFMFTSIPLYGGPDSFRWLVPFAYATAVVLPLWASTSLPRRAMVSAVATLLAGAALWQLLGGSANLPNWWPPGEPLAPVAKQHRQMIQFLEAEHALRGYAGYWDAVSLSWNSGVMVQAAPVVGCKPPGRTLTLCPYALNTYLGWYRPVAGVRSFLILDPGSTAGSWPPPKAYAVLATPVASRRFGEALVLVYPYDLASRMGCLDTRALLVTQCWRQ